MKKVEEKNCNTCKHHSEKRGHHYCAFKHCLMGELVFYPQKSPISETCDWQPIKRKNVLDFLERNGVENTVKIKEETRVIKYPLNEFKVKLKGGSLKCYRSNWGWVPSRLVEAGERCQTGEIPFTSGEIDVADIHHTKPYYLIFIVGEPYIFKEEI